MNRYPVAGAAKETDRLGLRHLHLSDFSAIEAKSFGPKIAQATYHCPVAAATFTWFSSENLAFMITKLVELMLVD